MLGRQSQGRGRSDAHTNGHRQEGQDQEKLCDGFLKLLEVQSAGQVVRLSGGLAVWAAFWTPNQKCFQREASGPKGECLVWLPPRQGASPLLSLPSTLPTARCHTCFFVQAVLSMPSLNAGFFRASPRPRLTCQTL